MFQTTNQYLICFQVTLVTLRIQVFHTTHRGTANVVLILALLKFHPASSRQNLTPPAEITQRHGLPVSQVTDLSARQSLGFSRVVSSLAGCLNFAFGKDWFLSWQDQVKAKETVRHRTTRLGPFYRIIVIRKCLQGSQTQILGRICTMRDSKAGPRQ